MLTSKDVQEIKKNIAAGNSYSLTIFVVYPLEQTPRIIKICALGAEAKGNKAKEVSYLSVLQ